MVEITPELVMRAYAAGIFPMAEDRDDDRLFWVDPEQRGILPLDRFHLPRRLRRTVANDVYAVTVDRAFADVIAACATAQPDRPDTWINTPIVALYSQLHDRGVAHSVEVWQGEELVGGLYGIALGAAFFGESMFSMARDASKVALVHLVGRLKRARFRLLDTQFVTAHLQQFGAIEIGREDYHRLLRRALDQSADFSLAGAALSSSEVLQSITQTS